MKHIWRCFFVLMALFTAGCESKHSAYKKSPYELHSIEYYETAINPGEVRFRFRNGQDVAKCIRASDFRRHPARPLLRVIDEETNEAAEYDGFIEDRAAHFEEPSYIIVRPGQTAEFTVNVVENYAVTSGQRYKVLYTLPVTNCRALISRDIFVPSASLPFDPLSTKPLDDWADRLQFVEDWEDEWAKVGEFVLLEAKLTVPE